MGQSAISCIDRRRASPETRLHRLTSCRGRDKLLLAGAVTDSTASEFEEIVMKGGDANMMLLYLVATKVGDNL
jgi:hypothetical protein